MQRVIPVYFRYQKLRYDSIASVCNEAIIDLCDRWSRYALLLDTKLGQAYIKDRDNPEMHSWIHTTGWELMWASSSNGIIALSGALMPSKKAMQMLRGSGHRRWFSWMIIGERSFLKTNL